MIRVCLGCVHVASDGTETFELYFEDDEGRCGSELEVQPDGSMKIVDLAEEP